MNEAVLDSSAVLALFLGESGEQQVKRHLPGARLSAVNLAEVVARLGAHGMSGDETRRNILALGISILPFDEDQAILCGDLREPTKAFGLSLGDRACLALSRLQGAKAVTADSAWRDVPDFDIQFIRDGGQRARP